MKYVRTKDGKILDLDRIELYAEYYCIDNKNQLYIEWYAVKETFEIIKQGDTIEELCDGYIIEYEDGSWNFETPHFAHYFAIRFDIQEETHIKNIFAYIKTDKGLIYVAKMNDKGELELL